jgi:hypothetical protein
MFCIMKTLLHQAHPWFKDVVWDKLYEMEAAFKPEVNGELDTQNFMKFDEVQLICTILLLLLIFCHHTIIVASTVIHVLPLLLLNPTSTTSSRRFYFGILTGPHFCSLRFRSYYYCDKI